MKARGELCLDSYDGPYIEEVLRTAVDSIESYVARHVGRGADVYVSISIEVADRCLARVSIDVEAVARYRIGGRVDLDVVVDGAINEAIREIEKRFREPPRKHSRDNLGG